MSDALPAPAVEDAASQAMDSAGAMLRQAREKQGMHIAMLAAMMKVTPKKLEALEGDRWQELPDLAFARALAQSVCRTLKVDPNPILAKLPALAKPEGLEHAAQGLNAPFREHADSQSEGDPWGFLTRPVFWATALVLGAALAVAFLPSATLKRFLPWAASSTATTDTSGITNDTKTGTVSSVVTPMIQGAGTTKPNTVVEPLATSPVVPSKTTGPAGPTGPMGPTRPEPTSAVLVETVHSAPAAVGAAASAATATEAAAGAIVVRAKAESWVEVQDAKGRALIARSLQAGETVGIDGEAPFKVRLGNVAGTDMRFKGEAVDLKSRDKGNTARFELK
jgi:cytoskeleton protein RodZ